LTCDPHILRPHCFSFTDPTTTATYTLSLHDALPISRYDLSPERPKPLSAFGATSALTFCIDGLSKSAGLPQVKLSWLAVSGPGELAREAMRRLSWLAATFLSVATPIQEALPRLLEHSVAFRGELGARLVRHL